MRRHLGSVKLPYHIAAFDIFWQTVDWPIAGNPTLTWHAPASTPDHIVIWRNTVPNWATASRLATLLGTATTYTDAGRAKDGTANYYWPIGYNADESGAGQVLGAQACYNSFTQTGAVAPLGVSGATRIMPFTTNIVGGGSFRAHDKLTILNFAPGPAPGDDIMGMGCDHVGFSQQDIIDTVHYIDGSAVGVTESFGSRGSSFNGGIVRAGTGQEGNWGIPFNSDAATFNYLGEVSYTDTFAGGLGGGLGPKPPPPPPAPPHAVALNPPPQATPLPCIPCCSSVCAMPVSPAAPVMRGF